MIFYCVEDFKGRFFTWGKAEYQVIGFISLGTGIRGLGAETITAVGSGDLPWLLSISLVLGALLGVLQLLADALFATSSLQLRGRSR